MIHGVVLVNWPQVKAQTLLSTVKPGLIRTGPSGPSTGLPWSWFSLLSAASMWAGSPHLLLQTYSDSR